MVWWLLTAAWAGSGLAPDAAPLIGPPVYLADGNGWQADILDDKPGRIRVWVYRDGAAAHDRLALEVERSGRAPRPAHLDADESHGNGHDEVWFRSGELVVSLWRPSGQVTDLAARLLELVVDAGSWPAVPALTRRESTLDISGQWARVQVTRPPRVSRSAGGPLAGLPQLQSEHVMPAGDGRFTVRAGDALTVRVWDAYGRGHVMSWTMPEGG